MDTSAPKPTEPVAAEQAPAKKNRLRGTLSSIGLLLLAPLFAIFLTTFVFQTYKVDGISMQNTLQNGDRLMVWKGSKSWDSLIGKQYVPARGDIVIVNQPDLSACGQTGRTIVKRVIGLPGEHIVYKNGSYTVYNTDHPDGFNPDTSLPYGQTDTGLLTDPTDPPVDVTLTATQIFVSGDHRLESCDSRRFGPVATNNIVGQLVLRVTPLSKAEKF